MKSLMSVENLPKNIFYNQALGFVSENTIEKTILEKQLVLTDDQLRHFSSTNYQRNGFYIGSISDVSQREKIDILQEHLARKPFKKRNSNLAIFNTMSFEDERRTTLGKEKRSSCHRIDGGRNMIHISQTNEKKVKAQAITVGDIIRQKIASDLSLPLNMTSDMKTNSMVLTLLETEAAVKDEKGLDVVQVPDQLMHCDVDSNDQTLNANDAFIGILATEKGLTELRVLPRSHESNITAATYEIPAFIYRVQLPQYYFFVGHPFLVHGGCGSALINRRLHFYHGLSQESQSNTCFPKWKVLDIADKMTQMRRAAQKTSKTATKRRKEAMRAIA